MRFQRERRFGNAGVRGAGADRTIGPYSWDRSSKDIKLSFIWEGRYAGRPYIKHARTQLPLQEIHVAGHQPDGTAKKHGAR